MREIRSRGSVEGMISNGHSYSDSMPPGESLPHQRYTASSPRKKEVARYLAEMGADVNARVRAGSEIRTPLQRATLGGHTDLLERLLAHGATE